MKNRNDILNGISPSPNRDTLESLSKQQIVAIFEAKLEAAQESWAYATKKASRKATKKALEEFIKKSKKAGKKRKKKKKPSKAGRWDKTIEKSAPELVKLATSITESVVQSRKARKERKSND
jgi:hypothetical protein